jgi:hypothetical protein
VLKREYVPNMCAECSKAIEQEGEDKKHEKPVEQIRPKKRHHRGKFYRGMWRMIRGSRKTKTRK